MQVIPIRKLTPELRRRLKAPLGLLITGSYKNTMEQLKRLIKERRPRMLVSVGDRVTENIVKTGLQPDVMIIDNRVMRKPIKPLDLRVNRVFRLRNPPSVITDEAWGTIGEALECGETAKVIVEGEEDLLTLVAILKAPVGSIVVYGQPYRGIVVVDVTEEMKETARRIVEEMEPSSKS